MVFEKYYSSVHPIRLENGNTLYRKYCGAPIKKFSMLDQYGCEYETLINWLKTKNDEGKREYIGIYVDKSKDPKSIIFTGACDDNSHMIDVIKELEFTNENDIILYDVDNKDFLLCPYQLKDFLIRE